MINEAIYFSEDAANPFSDARIMVTLSKDEIRSLLDALAAHDHVRSRQLHDEMEELLTLAEMRIFKILTNYNPCEAE